MHTVGLQIHSAEDLTWGTTISIGHGQHDLDHIGHQRDSQTVKEMQYGIGTALEYQMEKTSLALGADYTFFSNNGDDSPLVNEPGYVFGGDSMGRVMNIRLGVEELVTEWLALRAGYRYASNFKWDYDRSDLQDLTGSAKFNAWTVGAGIRYDLDDDSFFQAINLDYGAEYRVIGESDWQHLISVSTPFNLCL